MGRLQQRRRRAIMGSKGIPQREELVNYKNAVAGHAGTLCDPDGSLFIKPCTQAEIDFYEAAKASHPAFYSLLPIYMGTLTLFNAATASDAAGLGPLLAQQQQQQQQQPPPKEAHLLSPPPSHAQPPVLPALAVDKETWIPRGSMSIVTDRAIVLENTTFAYHKPNVVDVKLGQRLWADDAPAKKRQRMDQVRSSTTHDKLGFRIAGMRVYKGPVGGAGAGAGAGLDDAGYKVYDKNFGRFEVNEDNVVDAFRQYIYNESAGIDAEIGVAIARVFKAHLERVRDVLEQERTRMYSASLLFVFEGDGATLRAAVEGPSSSASASPSPSSVAAPEWEMAAATGSTVSMATATATATAAAAATVAGAETGIVVDRKSRREASFGDDDGDDRDKQADRSTSRTDSGIELDDAVESGEAGHEDRGEDDDDDEEEDVHPVYDLKLIDFAHATFVSEAEGPDENVLVGIRSLIRIFEELSK